MLLQGKGEGEKIRLKKKYLALIMVIMIIGVALLSSVVYSSVQANRIAYIAVRADKEVFTSAENVTFKLIPLAEGVQFTMNEQELYDRYYGVHVVKIPSEIDPAEVTANISLLDKLNSWDRSNIIVPVPSFNSTGEPLELSWNGTMLVGNDLLNGTEWVKATSGYYLLYPRLQWSEGHVTKFMLDDNAVFYYDSLSTNISTHHTADSFSMRMDISLGEGMPEGAYELVSRLRPMTFSDQEARSGPI